jgi:hypothetical protein
LAFLEGRGIEAVRDRIVIAGHAEFATIAVQHEDIFYVMSHYEQLLEAGELGEFANSKPPGTLLFYMLTNKFSGLFFTAKNNVEKLETLRNVATFLWPLLSYMVIVPLYCLARMLFGKEIAVLSCTLYLFVPSVNLITLHTDQVAFPLFFVTSVLLSAIACRRNSLLIAFFTGMFIYFSIWFTFGLAFALPFVAVVCYFLPGRQIDRAHYWPFVKMLTAITLGLLLSDILFRIIFNYDILLRYNNAVRFHLAWKNWVPTFTNSLYFGTLNLVEYVLWVGIPLSILAFMDVPKFIAESVGRRNVTLESIQPLVLSGTLFCMAFFGKTRGEVARIWLFLVPYICMMAAHTILTRYKNYKSVFVWAVIFLQLGTIYLTKINQDFW